jgi:hypothetical protein
MNTINEQISQSLNFFEVEAESSQNFESILNFIKSSKNTLLKFLGNITVIDYKVKETNKNISK